MRRVVVARNKQGDYSRTNFLSGMTLETKTKVIADYFNANYDQLCKYAWKIIKDRKRTYDAPEIVNEAYLYLMRCDRLDMNKVDQFCKAWISLTITKDRSFANLKMSLGDGYNPDGLVIADDVVEKYDDGEFEMLLNLIPTRRKNAINLLLKHVTIDECCKRTGTPKSKMKKELSMARASISVARKQLNQ